MNILVLAAGEHALEQPEISYPIWLTEADGTLLIERQVARLKELSAPRFIFMFTHSDLEAYHLDDIVAQMQLESTVLEVRRQTSGAACTALLALGAIDMDDELVIVSATDQLDIDFQSTVSRFHEQGADAGVLTFRSLHPRYSYVRLDENGWVQETAEKRPISDTANAGFYWFRKAADFFESAQSMIMKDSHVKGKFYICPSLNELVLRQKRIAALPLKKEQYHPLKSEREAYNLSEYLDQERSL